MDDRWGMLPTGRRFHWFGSMLGFVLCGFSAARPETLIEAPNELRCTVCQRFRGQGRDNYTDEKLEEP
jgi:hypothetical protein